jgi:hypothetical protein
MEILLLAAEDPVFYPIFRSRSAQSRLRFFFCSDVIARSGDTTMRVNTQRFVAVRDEVAQHTAENDALRRNATRRQFSHDVFIEAEHVHKYAAHRRAHR